MFQEAGKNNFKINVMPKTIEKYLSFIIKQTKKNAINPGLPIVFIDSIHFLNHLSDSVIKDLEENDFYHIIEKYEANVLD